jgi:hypothetical protein
MLFYALLQKLPGITQSATELILSSYGIRGSALSHDNLVLVPIRNESLCEELERDTFFANLNEGGLTLILLIEPNASGTVEVLYPNSCKESDAAADHAWSLLCKFLKVVYGREWKHKQRIWKNRNLVPCA